MPIISFWFITLALIELFVSMLFGIHMSATGNHSLSPAHGHLNLVGFVMSMLFGLYFAVFPRTISKLAWLQFWVHSLTAPLMFIGIIMAIESQEDHLAKATSVALVVSMMIFAWIHLRAPKATARRDNGIT